VIPRKSLFITFEGGEGAGKTTLIESLSRYLSDLGFEVLKTREPGGTKIGEQVRTLLLEKREDLLSPHAELSLFLASRAQHIFQIIKPALEENKMVLCDRFNDSSIAYQGIARGLGKTEVANACAFISQGLNPDLTFYLDIDPSIGLSRVKRSRIQDRIEAEGLEFHQKIRNAYLELLEESNGRIRRLDASLSSQEVFLESCRILQSLFRLKHV
jgi:dTMP kinase